jgi:hypothetical protein
LLFNQWDLEDNLASLEALAPDRAYLACLYQFLRREVNGRTEIDFDLALAARALAGSGFLHSKEYTVRVALAILGDLGLVASNTEGKTVRVKLYPAPPGKKDLRESPTFKRLQLFKQESITWMRKLLSEPVHNFFSL